MWGEGLNFFVHFLINTSSDIAFAMDLYDRGIVTTEDTGGIELSWGNVDAMEELIHQIVHREEFGNRQAADQGPVKGKTVDLKPMLRDFYHSMGWDEVGVPSEKKLKSLGLDLNLS